MNNYENIIFLTHNDNIGSDNLRGFQISKILSDNKIKLIPQYHVNTWNKRDNLFDELKNYKNSIFIWLWSIDICIINKFKNNNSNNIHIYDIVDKFLYDEQNIINILNLNYLDGIIVNNNYMKNYIYENTLFRKKIFVIYHHFDPIFTSSKLLNQNKLTFGYMGSLPSLNHTDNFLYYKKLIYKYPIELLNSEDGNYYTMQYINKEKIDFISTQKNLSNITINFNCHISIRNINSNTYKFKTTAKIATAACFNHNIITTYEESVKDILPIEYPFILKNDDYETICEMFDIVIKDYYGDKKLWNYGLSIMEDIKNKLSLKNIKNYYLDMFENVKF